MTLRYSLRSLLRDRGFAAVAVLTLALGIGANTAIFSLINGILLRQVPFRDPARLVTIDETAPTYPIFPVNGRHFQEWRHQAKSFEGMALIDGRRLSLTGAGQPAQLSVALISANLFPLLGVHPALGRGFLEEEDRPDHNRVVILSDALWRDRFSADMGIVGKTVLLDGIPHVVVGVMPPTYRFFANHDLHPMVGLDPQTDAFKPIAINPEKIGWGGEYNFMAIGRLSPGVSIEQARAELNVVEASIEQQHEAAEDRVGLRAMVTPLKDRITGQTRRGLLVLQAAVAAVLLIMCVNLANLMLARAVARRRDAAIRAALGASRGALAAQTVAEALILAATGGGLGIIAAYFGADLLGRTAPVDLPRLTDIYVDGSVLAFGIGLTLLTGLVFGILPALRLSRAEPADALRSGGRAATESARGLRLRSVLVASEVAISTVLLIAAGLLLHSFVRLLSIDKGFDTETVIATDITLPLNRYKDDAGQQGFYDRVLAKMREIPNVRASGIVSVLPLEGDGWGDAIQVAGEPRQQFSAQTLGRYRFVSPGYFSAMGIPLLAGRFIEERDRNAQPAVISERVAKQIFHGKNPIGRQFRRGDPDEKPFEVVGVAGDIRASSLESNAALMVYVPYWYRSRMRFSLVTRTAANPVSAAPAIRAAVRDVDPEVPVSHMRTMAQVVDRSVAPRRFQTTLVLIFAGAALILAGLGIYGVVSYLVTQRRSEIGIRMALGATSPEIHAMVLRQGLTPVLLGLTVGVIGALAAGKMLHSLLFQVSESDPATFLGVSAVLLAIAAISCYLPSWKAVNCDPAIVLRYE